MAHNIMGMDPCDGENHEIFNTTSQKRTFVDARTGLFEVYVPLPPVTCNNGLGPVIDMSLFYTPMVNNRAGLGDGWSFAFTTYDEKRQQLRLHSGEAVEVSRDESLGTTTIIACWSEDKTTLTVKRPDGRVEVLKQVEDSGIFTPIRLSLDGINFASLEWSAKEWISASDSYRHVRLIGIDDDYDQLSEDTKVKPLHHDDYVNKYRQVHIEYPERGEADLQIKIKYWQYDDIAANTYHLALKDFALREVILPGGDKFAFSYDDHPTCGWLLNEVVTPEGLSESVEYVDNGLPFKDDEKLSALPCVSTHTVRPVNGASVVETTYEYFSEPVVPINEVHRELSSIGVPVLHYGGVFSVPISDDMNCDFSEAVDGYIEFVKLTAINESLSGTEFDQLEPDCDLVSVYGHYWYRTVVVCGDRHEEILYTHKHQVFSSTVFGASGPRDKVVIEYHVLGDSILTQETSPNKVSASSQVYYTKGLMTRRETAERTVAWSYDRAEHLVDTKDKYNYVFTLARMTAEAVSYPQGGGITTHYTYGKTGIRPLSREVVLSNDATKKLKHSYLYGERGLSQETVRQPDGTETKKTITHSVSGRAVTTVVVEAFNGVEKTTSQTISTLDGRLLGERDADGNLSEYGYDNLGRLLSHTTCAQSAAYKEVTQYSYPSAARVEVLEPGGIRRAYDYDGRGNVVNEYIAAPVGKNEKTVPWKLMLQREYDNQGRNNAIVHYDYLPSGNGTKTVSQRCDYAYDSRGEVEVTRLSTGEVFVNKYYADVGVRIERQGDPGDLNGKFTEYNVDGSIAWIEWKEGAEITQKREGFQYKAPGLVAAHVTAVKGSAHVVKYVHDYAGRCTLEEHFWTTGDDFSASRLSSLMNKHSGPATQSYTYEYADDVTINEPISVSLNGQVVGLREVDDAGRLLSVTRDGYTESFAYNGASQAPVSKTTADGKILKYTYFKEMGNRVASISEQTSSLKQTFTYATAGSRQSSAAEGERKVGFIHDPFGHVSNYEAQLQAKVAAAQGKPAQAAAAKSITYQRSVGGRLLSEEDAAGGKTDFTYDDHGRRSGASHVHAGGAEQSQLEVKYDRHGRMASECLNIGRKVSEGDKGKFKHSVALSYVYDGEHREISRTLKTPKGDFVITRDYDAGGRLAKTEIKQGKTVLGGRTLTYNREGRLDTCNTSGIWQPQTPKGKTIEKQAFKYDGLGNLTRCESTYEGTVCVSTFKYTGTRLVEVKHSAADFGTDSTLAYDEAGRVVKDQHGKTYEYDALGRRVKVGSKRYTYDPLSKLMASGDGADQKQIIYDDLTVRGEYAVTGDSLRHCCLEGAGVSVVYQVKSGVKRFLVQLMDATGTVVLSHDLTADTLAHHAYTAYGCHSSSEKEALAGFNGEYRDPEHDQYPLGNGYRWYAPDAMRFSAPDSASPFGNGGPHPYAYCDGDPINRQDPTGHIAFIPAFIGFLGLALLMRGGQKLMNKYLGEKATNLINTGIWAGLGVLTALASGGLSLYVYAAVVALSVISFVTAVTSVLISETHPQAAEILGWVSFATTIAAGVVGAAKKAVEFANKAFKKIRDQIGRSGRSVRHLLRKAVRANPRSNPRVAPQQRETIEFYDLMNHRPSVVESDILMAELGRPSVRQPAWIELRHLFDSGDANTLLCTITGVLGLTNYFEHEEAAGLNGQLNNQTWLPVGNWKGFATFYHLR